MPHKQTEQVAFTELFWPLCFDCLCCMHKIFMLWKICSNKKRRGFLLEPPFLNFSPCACNFSHSNEITSKKKRRGKLCYLNVALSLWLLPFSFLLLSALYQPFCHGSVNAQLPAFHRERAREIDVNFSLITIFH